MVSHVFVHISYEQYYIFIVLVAEGSVRQFEILGDFVHRSISWSRGCVYLRVIKLSFPQNDRLMGESFWQNSSLVTHILFELFFEFTKA